ncbi:MAG: phosphotransferase [Spirochaetia bacterium]|nr:phosphotransferase [Spirochaetia bacterium]
MGQVLEDVFLSLKKNTGFDFEILPLRVEASARRYFRLEFSSEVEAALCIENSGSVQTLVMVPDPQKILSCSVLICINSDEKDFIHSDFYAIGSSLLENKFNVPAIYGFNDEKNFFTGAFSGSCDLSQFLDGSSESSEKMIYRSLDFLVKLHSLEAPEPVRSRFFDREKFDFEKHFLLNALEKIEKGLSETKTVKLMCGEYERFVNEVIQKNDFVFTHRDFHSRNIILSELSENADMTVIDFQDARMGHRYYDLSSFLFDPYTGFSANLIQKGFRYYSDQSGFPADQTIFYYQAMQRILKALGSYLFLVNEKKQSEFLPSILSACRILNLIMDEADEKGPVKEFTGFIQSEIYPKLKYK